MTPNLLEVTGDHIAKLSDSDLRELITRLCEAELRRCNLPISAVTAGGHQDAPDGGIDVRVSLGRISSTCLDYVQKPNTGFQVKATSMSAAQIIAEMRPRGTLRPSIQDLAAIDGAYVIVSSHESLTDTSLRGRLDAMRNAVPGLSGGSSIKLDFYDRERLVSWVRTYPGIALWIRERIGEPLSGWRPYGNWAFGDPSGSEFVLDQTTRVYAGNKEKPIDVVEGINLMRAALSVSGGVVRLVGLSGVGKTRLVQALFDIRIGEAPLDSSTVLYADQGAEPIPSARDMLNRILTAGMRAVVIVDNCNPATHRALAQAVKASGSSASLLTVEYDVADDEPEDTDVFHLEPASDNVVEKILERLAPSVSRPNRTRIAEFSSGNARVALALSKTFLGNESVGVLNDAELFKRLFVQNQQADPVLLRIGEVCSLVYSFSGDPKEGANAELSVLASLAGVSVGDMYRGVGQLRARDLVQERGKWRAVLPHAIANRLAKQALTRIPSGTLVEALSANSRLLKSFARRLGFLHDSTEAIQIAESWFKDDRWLANAARLSEVGIALFHSVAPLCPTLAMEAMEKAASSDGASDFLASDFSNRQRWIWLARALAYESAIFERAARFVARMVAASSAHGNRENAKSNFEELFHIVLSGTKALIEQRISFLRDLFRDVDPSMRELAYVGLNGLLKNGQFSSGHDFSFGARPRDFGWHPQTDEEISNWYRAVLGLVEDVGKKESQRTRELLGRHFRGLWMHANIHADLVALGNSMAEGEGWPEGWIAVRMTIKYARKEMPLASMEQLRELEQKLRPKDIEQKLEAYVLSQAHGHFDIADAEATDENAEGIMAGWRLAHQIAESLGAQFAGNPELLSRSLPKLIGREQGRQAAFGHGLAKAVADAKAKWQEICNVFAEMDPSRRHIALLQGYINGVMERDPQVAGQLLDDAVDDPNLASYFPTLQAAVAVDDTGAARLLRSIALGRAKSWTYRNLGFGRASDRITPSAFRKLLLGIVGLPGGFPIAIDLLRMRLHTFKADKILIDQESLALGRELLIRCTFDDENDNIDYHVAEIARACMAGSTAALEAKQVCENFLHALKGDSKAWSYDQLARVLFELQPEVALDVFFEKSDNRHRSVLFRMSMIDEQDGPVNRVPKEILLSWAGKDVANRFPWIAREIRLFDKRIDGSFEWSTIALHLLEHATDRKAVLSAFGAHIVPGSWSGSLADVLIPYLQPIRALLGHEDSAVREWASTCERGMQERIDDARSQDRKTDASFE